MDLDLSEFINRSVETAMECGRLAGMIEAIRNIVKEEFKTTFPDSTSRAVALVLGIEIPQKEGEKTVDVDG